MKTRELLQDAALAGVAGYLATKVMEQFNTRAYELEPPADREREASVRPGPPFRMAAENLSQRVLDVELDEDRAKKAGLAFHYLAGLSWTPVYLMLRRKLGWSPVASGLVTGASMSQAAGRDNHPCRRRIGTQRPVSRVHPRPRLRCPPRVRSDGCGRRRDRLEVDGATLTTQTSAGTHDRHRRRRGGPIPTR